MLDHPEALPPISPATTERLESGRHVPRQGPPAAPHDPVLHAYVSHGRWIAECPDCSAAVIPPLRHPTFVCLECGNVRHGGRALEVVWPADAALVAAELVLLARPRPNRNWHPQLETVHELELENLNRGYATDPAAYRTSPDGIVKRL